MKNTQIHNNLSILFLDIDHVLTNTSIDGTSFMSFDPSRYKLSKHNLKILDSFLRKSNAKIVISSNWRRFPDNNPIWMLNGKSYYSPLISFRRLYAAYIVDELPKDRHLTKCEALELWCEDNCTWFDKTSSHYVIFEDDPDEGYQAHPFFSKHLVMTSPSTGLTYNDVDKALKIIYA